MTQYAHVLECAYIVLLQVPGRSGSSGQADIASLQQQSQAIQTDINELEQQLLLTRQQCKQISLDQQISGEHCIY